MNGIVGRHAALLLVLALIGCSNDRTSSARAAVDERDTRKTEDMWGGILSLGGGPYRPVALGPVGAVAGSITFSGVAPVDTTPISADQEICGATPPPPVGSNANGLSNTLVWIADAKTGKARPIEKRVVILSEHCALEPRVQATVVGAAVNVLNDDPLLHRLVFTRSGTHDTLTVMRFFNEGQVVPSERLTTKTGVVEIRCVQHPWTHDYIAVFDHPYFAVTAGDGRFKIDSLLPGSYTMMVWHHGTPKPIERKVTIAAGATADVDVAMALTGR